MTPFVKGVQKMETTEDKAITLEEWMTEGTKLFGKDMMKWKFVCPVCGNVQSAEDFRQYKDGGATPDSARQECIGRYANTGRDAFTEKGKGPCNYAAYGLFRLSPVRVKHEGEVQQCFGFAK